jgi:ribosomal protein S18 acetylase RimI-like enzyme
MPISLGLAIPQDAQAISQIIELAFHEQASFEQIQQLIIDGNHCTWVAETVESKEIVGFVDGFMTIAQEGTRRFELDLIAVHPDFAGQGIGKQLIHTFSENVIDADIIRTLVAVNNTAMQRAMTATGYQLETQVHSLYISSNSDEKTNRATESHLIPVETFTYSGIWLEGEITKEAIQAAQYQRQKCGSDVIGAVISTENTKAIELVQSTGFEYIKDFQWWTKIP